MPSVPWAHEALAPSKIELVNELRGINAELRAGQTHLDQSLVWDRSTTARAISRAQISFFAEDYAVAAGRLLRLVARPGFETHPGYPEAVSYLGEAFVQLGLEATGVRHLREALDHPRLAPTQFRARFARYLELAADHEDLKHARRLWRKFQTLRPAGPMEAQDREARYQYAKVLFRGGAITEAENLFEAIDLDDPRFLQARYFVGVLALSRGDELTAKDAFDDALAEWQLARPQAKTAWLDDIDDDGPERELVDLNAEDPEKEDIEQSRRARMGAVIQLAVARLAAARGNNAFAWQNYRGVPPGDPDFAAALYEASYVLFKRDEHAWCVRVVDQLLAARGDDVSAATLALWRGQLLARSARFEAAKASYVELKQALDRRAIELEADINESRRLFAPAVLAWSAPDDANRARKLEAELVEQREALIEANEIAETLRELAATRDLLPATRQGKALHKRLSKRLAEFGGRLDFARNEAHPDGEDDLPHSGGVPATVADVRRIEASALRLKQRIERFERQLVSFEAAYRRRITKALGAEGPVLKGLERELADQMRNGERLAMAMRSTARQNLQTYAAEALFGQVDLAWWRKQEASDRVTAAHRARNAAIERLSEDMPPSTAEIPTLPAQPAPSQRPAEPADDKPAEPGDEPDQLAHAGR